MDASAGYGEVPYKTATLGGEKLELAPSAFVLLAKDFAQSVRNKEHKKDAIEEISDYLY